MVWTAAYGVQKNIKTKLLNVSLIAGLLLSMIAQSAPFVFGTAKAAPVSDRVVINEVMPDPLGDEKEWVELYNPTPMTVDMSGWRIKNGTTNFSGVFPAGTTIPANGFLLREAPDSDSILNNTTKQLLLQSDSSGTLVNDVTYSVADEGQSYARTYDASPYFEARSGAGVTKNASNGTAPVVAAPVITKIDAYYKKDTYKGIAVDIHVNNLTDATGVEIKVDRTSGSSVVKTNKSTGGVLAALNTGSAASTTAPMVIQQGSYNEAGSGSWNQPSATWNSSTTPTSITVTITRNVGPPLVETIDISEVGTPFATLAEVMPKTVSTQKVYSDTAPDSNQQGWLFNRDVSTTTPFEFNSSEAKIGTGSLYVKPIGGNASDKFIAEYFLKSPVSEVSSISYDFKMGSGGDVSDASQFYMNAYVNFNGDYSDYGHCVYSIIPSTYSGWVTTSFDPTQNYSVRQRGSAPATCPSSPASIPGGVLRMFALNLGDTSTSDVGLDGYFDNVVVETTEAKTTFDFEPFVNAPSSSAFIYPQKYVRANNATDVSAQVKIPGAANEVRFHFDGATDSSNVSGYEHLQANQWPSASGQKQFRVKHALQPGQYTVTAEYKVGNSWHPVTGSALAFSVDTPWATYTTPVEGGVYRPSDNPVRLRVDDQFKQFNYADVEVNGITHRVNRASCDLRAEGNYLFCDVATSATWDPLAAGQYNATSKVVTKANSHLDNLTSTQFRIDSEEPVVSNFAAPALAGLNKVVVSADATDDIGIDRVRFYLSERNDQKVCENNLAAIREAYGVKGSGDTYTAEINTQGLNGDDYCVLVSARDIATHNSTPLFKAVTIDNTAPVWQLNPVHQLPSDQTQITVGSPILMQWSTATDSNGVKYYYNVSAVNGDTTGNDNRLVNPFYIPFGPFSNPELNATGTALGTYWWQVKACDDLDNCTAWTNPWQGSVIEAASENTEINGGESEDEEANPPTDTNGDNDTADDGEQDGQGLLGDTDSNETDNFPISFANAGNQEDGNAETVAGASTDVPVINEFASAGNTLGAVAANDAAGCSKILGLCWYYWPPIVVAILTGGYYLYSRRETKGA